MVSGLRAPRCAPGCPCARARPARIRGHAPRARRWWEPSHAAVGHHTDPTDAEAAAQAIDDRNEHADIGARMRSNQGSEPPGMSPPLVSGMLDFEPRPGPPRAVWCILPLRHDPFQAEGAPKRDLAVSIQVVTIA